MAKRVVDTTVRFIGNNIGTSKIGNEIMKDLDAATEFGRTSETSFKNCLHLIGSFGTKKELSSSTLFQRTQNNLSGKNYKHAVKTVHKELEGHLLEDKISSAQMAFIYLQIQNNLRVPIAELCSKHGIEMILKPKPNLLKFTSSVNRNRTGGWSQEGIDLYFQYYEREKKERKEMTNKYQGEARGNRCDYFHSAVGTQDDSDSILEDDNKEAEIVDYEDEYSTNNSVHSNGHADLYD
eukprot:scaffold8209_cov32-Attheya_sp.AAC.1